MLFTKFFPSLILGDLKTRFSFESIQIKFKINWKIMQNQKSHNKICMQIHLIFINESVQIG